MPVKPNFNPAYFYFVTTTAIGHIHLFRQDRVKRIIVDSFQHLRSTRAMKLFVFVIMPNHIHVIWEMINTNGKEMPYASFNKFTSHQFLEYLRKKTSGALFYQEITTERRHRFWQRDPLAVYMDSKEKAEQKLDYIHLNPLQEKWNLVINPVDYKWSSARFYETGVDEFDILTDYRERF